MMRLTRWCLAIGLLLWLTRFLIAAASASTALPTIGEIRQRADLVVLEAAMEKLCVKERAGLVGGVELTLIARGSVLISTDLSKARYAAVDETLRQATLVLPNPEVLWARLDPYQSQVHRLSRYGLWFMVIGDAGESELVELAWREAQQAFVQRGADPELITKAKQQSVAVLTKMFERSDWEVKIVWH